MSNQRIFVGAVRKTDEKVPPQYARPLTVCRHWPICSRLGRHYYHSLEVEAVSSGPFS